MIQDYVPTAKNVLEVLFDRCSHEDLDGKFCKDCSSFVQEEDLKEIRELEDALSGKGIKGGVLLERVLDFITLHAKITIGTGLNGNRHDICMTLSGSKNVYASGHKSFGYNICWFADILRAWLEDSGVSIHHIRRKINEN